MAMISISADEIFERAKEFNLLPGAIENLYSDNDDNIITEIALGRLLPSLKMKLSFAEFNEGKAIFKIKSPAALKLPAKLVKKQLYEDIVIVEKGNLIIDLNKAIEKKTDKVKIREMDFSNEMFTIKI